MAPEFRILINRLCTSFAEMYSILLTAFAIVDKLDDEFTDETWSIRIVGGETRISPRSMTGPALLFELQKHNRREDYDILLRDYVAFLFSCQAAFLALFTLSASNQQSAPVSFAIDNAIAITSEVLAHI